MKFEAADRDWSDFGPDMARARRRRYEKLLDAIIDGLERILKRHAGKSLAINARVPVGIFSTGVVGDQRMYGPIVILTYECFPGYDHLQKISTDITNSLPVSRVTYDFTTKVVCTPTVQFLVSNKKVEL
ncbi:MAG: hypothetical protein Q8P23_04455 [bacterium]|nr:hypothetical protein [bacterium]